MSDSIPLYSFEYFSKAAGRDRHITGWHRKKRKIVPDADFVLDGMDMERVRELLLGE